MTRATQEPHSDSRTPFERFEDMARRIVNVPRKDVPPVKHTPRPKPPASKKKPKSG